MRQRRKELGLTQQGAARALGVGHSTLKNWERGRTEIRESLYPLVIRFLGHDPNPVPQSLAERIRAARQLSGLSQKALALRLGLDPSTLRAWEAGRGESGHGQVREALEAYLAERSMEEAGGPGI